MQNWADREPLHYEDQTDRDSNSDRQFHNVSVSLRSMRERRRNGAKNSRGPG